MDKCFRAIASLLCGASKIIASDRNAIARRAFLLMTTNPVTVLAPVQGKALKRRPCGRPGLPLRAAALRILVGTWGNRGAPSLLVFAL